MKKASKLKTLKVNKQDSSLVSEPEVFYIVGSRLPKVTDFPFSRLKKLFSKVPFTRKEWAFVLHLSERTLQRYALENKNFEGIYVDRILHLEKMVSIGIGTFQSGNAFYKWLKKEKHVLGHNLNFDSLSSMQGIDDVIDELGRIQYGVFV